MNGSRVVFPHPIFHSEWCLPLSPSYRSVVPLLCHRASCFVRAWCVFSVFTTSEKTPTDVVHYVLKIFSFFTTPQAQTYYCKKGNNRGGTARNHPQHTNLWRSSFSFLAVFNVVFNAMSDCRNRKQSPHKSNLV
jgi:hypothetical protein